MNLYEGERRVINQTVENATQLAPLSEASQMVLRLAGEEAIELDHRHLGAEHLLLGLLRLPRDRDRLLGYLLATYVPGTQDEQLAQATEVIDFLFQDPDISTQSVPQGATFQLTPRLRKIMEFARKINPNQPIEPVDLFGGLLIEGENLGEGVLTSNLKGFPLFPSLPTYSHERANLFYVLKREAQTAVKGIK